MCKGASQLYVQARSTYPLDLYVQVMAYLAVHPKFGTHVFFPYMGARHGGVDKEEEGNMYDGFVFWWHGADSLMLKRIISHNYYNSTKALEKASPFITHSMQQEEFDPSMFLVSPTCVSHAGCHY